MRWGRIPASIKCLPQEVAKATRVLLGVEGGGSLVPERPYPNAGTESAKFIPSPGVGPWPACFLLSFPFLQYKPNPNRV